MRRIQERPALLDRFRGTRGRKVALFAALALLGHALVLTAQALPGWTEGLGDGPLVICRALQGQDGPGKVASLDDCPVCQVQAPGQGLAPPDAPALVAGLPSVEVPGAGFDDTPSHEGPLDGPRSRAPPVLA